MSQADKSRNNYISLWRPNGKNKHCKENSAELNRGIKNYSVWLFKIYNYVLLLLKDLKSDF